MPICAAKMAPDAFKIYNEFDTNPIKLAARPNDDIFVRVSGTLLAFLLLLVEAHDDRSGIHFGESKAPNSKSCNFSLLKRRFWQGRDGASWIDMARTTKIINCSATEITTFSFALLLQIASFEASRAIVPFQPTRN